MSTDVRALVELALAGRVDCAEVEQWVEQNREHYRRPKLEGQEGKGRLPSRAAADEFIDLFSDWEERAQTLANLINQLNRSAWSENRDNTENIRPARLLYILSKLVDDPARHGYGAFVLGYAFWRTKRWFDAAEMLSEAVPLLRADQEDPTLEVTALSYLCNSLREDKRFDQAIERAEQLRERARALNLRGHEALGLKDLGESHAHLGRAEEATRYLREAVSKRRQLSGQEATEQSVVPLTAFLNSFGLAARKFGHYDEAFQAFLENVEIHRSENARDMEALALSEIAYTYLEIGDAAKAAEFLSLAIAQEEASGSPRNSPRWRTQLARLRQGDSRGIFGGRGTHSEPQSVEPDQEAIADTASAYHMAERAADFALSAEGGERAIALAEKVLNWAVQQGDVSLQVVCYNVLGVGYEKLGRSKDSARSFRKGIQLADGKGGGSGASLTLRYNLAKALLTTKEYDQCVEVLQSGLAFSQMLLGQTGSFAFKQQIIAGALPLYELLVSFLGQAGADQNHRHIVKYTELVRARNIAAWARAQGYLEGLELPREVRDPIRTRMRQMRANEVELDLRHLMGKLSAEQATRLQDGVKTLEKEILELTSGAASASRLPVKPSFDPQQETNEALQTVLSRDAVAILSLFSTPEGVCASLSYGRDGDAKFSGSFIRWDQDERVGLLSVLNEHMVMARSRAAVFREAVGREAGSQNDPSHDDALASTLNAINTRLFNELGDLVQRVSPRELFIIPHRELSIMPFWQLADRCSSIEKVAVVPSLSVAQVCTKRRRKAAGRTCVVGDLTRTLPQAAAELQVVAMARREQLETVTSVDQLVASAENCSLMHVAAHGLFNPQNPYLSGFLLGRGEPANDLFVQYAELFSSRGGIAFEFSDKPQGRCYRLMTVADCMAKLSLDSCRLVVLSACESGVAHTHGGGELMGLPNSLLVAGAKSVIAPLWPVDDTATMVLMKSFYRLWEGGRGTNSSPAHCLALARQELRKMRRSEIAGIIGSDNTIPGGERPYASPIYADAFQCFGDF